MHLLNSILSPRWKLGTSLAGEFLLVTQMAGHNEKHFLCRLIYLSLGSRHAFLVEMLSVLGFAAAKSKLYFQIANPAKKWVGPRVLLIGQENKLSYLSSLEVPPCETNAPSTIIVNIGFCGWNCKPPSLV